MTSFDWQIAFYREIVRNIRRADYYLSRGNDAYHLWQLNCAASGIEAIEHARNKSGKKIRLAFRILVGILYSRLPSSREDSRHHCRSHEGKE